MEKEKKIVVNEKGKKHFKQYLADKPGVRIDTMWEDIEALEGDKKENLGHTQHKNRLLY